MLHKLCEEIIKYANNVYVQQIKNWIRIKVLCQQANQTFTFVIFINTCICPQK